MSKRPYHDQDLEVLQVYLKRALDYMKGLEKDNPKREEAIERFIQLLEYYLERTKPIGGFGILVDTEKGRQGIIYDQAQTQK